MNTPLKGWNHISYLQGRTLSLIQGCPMSYISPYKGRIQCLIAALLGSIQYSLAAWAKVIRLQPINKISFSYFLYLLWVWNIYLFLHKFNYFHLILFFDIGFVTWLLATGYSLFPIGQLKSNYLHWTGPVYLL